MIKLKINKICIKNPRKKIKIKRIKIKLENIIDQIDKNNIS